MSAPAVWAQLLITSEYETLVRTKALETVPAVGEVIRHLGLDLVVTGVESCHQPDRYTHRIYLWLADAWAPELAGDVMP